MIRLIEATGEQHDNPSYVDVHDRIADMNMRWRFVIIENLDRAPAGQHFWA